MSIDTVALKASLTDIKHSDSWQRIARKACVNYTTLVRFISGECEPRTLTLRAIHKATAAEIARRKRLGADRVAA